MIKLPVYRRYLPLLTRDWEGIWYETYLWLANDNGYPWG